MGDGSSCEDCPPGRFAFSTAQVDCVPCGPGLVSALDGSSCVPQAFIQPTGIPSRWNTSGLAEAWTAVAGFQGEVTMDGRYFYISLLHASSPPSVATEVTSEKSFWWEIIPTCPVVKVRSVGAIFDAIQVTNEGQVVANFSGTCISDGISRHRVASITFHCDPEAVAGNSEWGSVIDDLELITSGKRVSVNSCDDIALQWRTAAACPVCEDDDVVTVRTSACNARGMQTTSQVRLVSCTGGAQLAGASEVRCGADMILLTIALVFLGSVLCCMSTYVMLLRRRYRKYMQLTDPADAVAPETVGKALP